LKRFVGLINRGEQFWRCFHRQALMQLHHPAADRFKVCRV
jgi:hypothetical protein